MEIENDEDIEEGDANIQYGYRRSRRSTSYMYRGSSSLTPAQIMEPETYHSYAKVAVQRSRESRNNTLPLASVYGGLV
jgi:hypothetical protein